MQMWRDVPSEVKLQLSTIRKRMSAALRQNDRAEYHRLGAQHRDLLHSVSYGIKKAWEACA